jgi:predicted PurR-regulated permease PerM
MSTSTGTPADAPASALDGRTATAVRQDLARITLAVLCMLLLVAGSLWVLRPFLGAAIWATMLVVSTWPLLVSLQRRLGGRRGPAVAVMTAAMLLLVIVPVWAAIATIVGYAGQAAAVTQKLTETGLPQPPAWVAGLPLVGGKVASTWTTLAEAGPQGLAAVLRPYADDAARWVLGQAGSVVGLLVQFVLVVVLSAILYSNGEVAARAVRRFGHRLAGSRGEGVVVLAGQAIRGVALGVGATAVVQTVLGSVGLLVAGVPLVRLLAALMLVLCIAQVGPGLVLFGAVGWMYWRGEHTWATVLLVWAVLVQLLDNVLRPVLIRKGADLPLLLIFAGVIGGMLGFGLVGLFIGPVVLAVSYTLVAAWIEEGLGEA